MNKIEEILCKHLDVEHEDVYDCDHGVSAKLEYETHRSSHLPDSLVSAIKEYAEHYAQKCLEIAANSATGRPLYDYSNRYHSELIEDDVNIDIDSILNIKLPEHD